MAHQREEQLHLFFLDGRNALVADEVQSKGTVNHTPLYVREVVKRALELGASALIMAHKDPARYPTGTLDHNVSASHGSQLPHEQPRHVGGALSSRPAA
jgi:DNA repair protein RadC